MPIAPTQTRRLTDHECLERFQQLEKQLAQAEAKRARQTAHIEKLKACMTRLFATFLQED
jgi:hypothetical protein